MRPAPAPASARRPSAAAVASTPEENMKAIAGSTGATGMRRARGCVRRRAALLLALCGAACAALGGGPGVSAGGAEADATLPAAGPADVARLLADFAAHARLLPHV